MQKVDVPVILASGSTARQAILRKAGLRFSVISADIDEAAIKSAAAGTARALAMELAMAKAARISALQPRALVIGADQILVCEGRHFDKPENLEAAAAHLKALSGRRHGLVTACCVYQNKVKLWDCLAEPELTMRKLSDDFIVRYLAAEGEAVCNCVGAYRLEGLGSQLFVAAEGDFFTILGLPLLALLAFLRSAGVLGA